MKVALCCIIKNENCYMQEYVEHYKKLGFSKIFLYDNNNADGEKPGDVLEDYVKTDFVEIINYRGKSCCQCEAYQECYHKHNSEYDWIAFFDADEFLWLNKSFNNVIDFLSQNIFNNALWIYVNWLPYGDSNQLHYNKAPVAERFQYPSETVQGHIDLTVRKSILRGHINNLLWDMSLPHANSHKPNILFGANGALPAQSLNVLGHITRPWDTTTLEILECTQVCHLKHYCTKSTEEYMLKRMRGYPDHKWNFDINEIVSTYFKYNTYSDEKLNVLLETFHNNKSKYNL